MILTPEFLADLAHYNAGVRRAVAANRAQAPDVGRIPQPCGTNAGYKRHRRQGERPCGPCIAAASATWKADHQLRKARKAAREVGK